MKTTLGILEDAKSILLQNGIIEETNITGEVRLISRVLNSKLEDIVLSAVYSEAEQVQESRINVNIYTPNLKRQPSNTSQVIDNTQADIYRVFEISNFVMKTLGGYRGNKFFIEIYSSPEIIDFEGETFVNIQLTYNRLHS